MSGVNTFAMDERSLHLYAFRDWLHQAPMFWQQLSERRLYLPPELAQLVLAATVQAELLQKDMLR